MIVNIESDEWYPVYFVHTSGDEVEVDAPTLERWQKVADEFQAVQDEMSTAWHKARARKR